MYFLGGIFVLVIMVMHVLWSEREEFLPLLFDSLPNSLGMFVTCIYIMCTQEFLFSIELT